MNKVLITAQTVEMTTEIAQAVQRVIAKGGKVEVVPITETPLISRTFRAITSLKEHELAVLILHSGFLYEADGKKRYGMAILEFAKSLNSSNLKVLYLTSPDLDARTKPGITPDCTMKYCHGSRYESLLRTVEAMFSQMSAASQHS